MDYLFNTTSTTQVFFWVCHSWATIVFPTNTLLSHDSAEYRAGNRKFILVCNIVMQGKWNDNIPSRKGTVSSKPCCMQISYPIAIQIFFLIERLSNLQCYSLETICHYFHIFQLNFLLTEMNEYCWTSQRATMNCIVEQQQNMAQAVF